MNWKKAIGFGVILYVVMFFIVSIFVAFKIYNGDWIKFLTAIIGGVVSYILAGYIKPLTYGQALNYGIVWVAISAIFDAVITLRFDPTIFSQWTMWFGYVLIILAPLLRVKKINQTV